MAEISARLELKGWNATQLKLRIPTIIRAYGDVMDAQLKEEIQAVQFSWPRQTRRYGRLLRESNLKRRANIRAEQGGLPYVVVGSPRDIVDSGNFLRSQRRDYPDTTTLRFTWDAKSDTGFMYAGLILTGYTTDRGTPVPGRNWIKPALDKHPLNAFFIREWRALSNQNL
jgi:hypothetical protein